MVKNLYDNSPYFKTLLDNSEMAMKKCFFPLTETFSLASQIWENLDDDL